MFAQKDAVTLLMAVRKLPQRDNVGRATIDGGGPFWATLPHLRDLIVVVQN